MFAGAGICLAPEIPGFRSAGFLSGDLVLDRSLRFLLTFGDEVSYRTRALFRRPAA
jgi:hypothetical protein